MPARLILPALFLFTLPACVSVLPSPNAPDALYQIGPMPAARGLPAILAIREPDAPEILGGSAMVVRASDDSIRFLPGVEWAGSPTRMMQTGLIDLLSGEGEGLAIDAGNGARADFEVSWRIIDLALEDGAAHCALDILLLDGRTREPLARIRPDIQRQGGGQDAASRARTLTGAAEACLAEAADWISAQTAARIG